MKDFAGTLIIFHQPQVLKEFEHKVWTKTFDGTFGALARTSDRLIERTDGNC